MRRTSMTVVLALATLLFVSTSSAQQTSTTAVPNLIRYGGTLKDGNGAPIEATTGVTFAIYKQQDGGAPVWQETQNVTADASGQYSVILGSTTSTGLPDDLFSQQEQRWLGVQVQGESEQSRVLLVSVPYAFKAHEAETLGGLPASAFVKAPPTDASGSGSTDAGTVVNALSNAGNAGMTSGSGKTPPAGPINGGPCPSASIAPASNYIPIFLNPTTVCNSVIFQTPLGALGNVGINTITPGAQLDVNGGTTSGINTTNNRKAYMIGLSPVLTVVGTGNLFAGLNAGINDPLNTNTGTFNTFVGQSAGTVNTTGGDNAFFGATAGTANVNGRLNTFTGSAAGHQNVGGSQNTFVGWDAGGGNVNSNNNTYVGLSAAFNMTGANNTCVGAFCGNNFTNPITGGNNIFVGTAAGSSSGGNSNNNIYMGNTGAPENSTIRIGTQGLHLSTYIAGIYGNPNTNLPSVLVDNTGRLWQGPTGGSGVGGTCNSPAGGTYLTGWVGSGLSNTVGCSFLFQQATTNFIGIGTTNPSTTLDVNGDINAAPDQSSYRIGGVPVLTALGTFNLFVGPGAGAHDVTPSGQYNTFSGASAGFSNTTGSGNTFSGATAGFSNNTGHDNTFTGLGAGFVNATGFNNTFTGFGAGSNNTGHDNTFYGHYAGAGNTTGSNDVYIANPGPGTESNTIRIGGNQTAAYIAGIHGSTSSGGIAVYVNAAGQLGTSTSSLRFKEQVRDMGDRTNALMKLRPVVFFYKPQYDDGSHLLQYGLIAEEVAKVYPEMVAYDKDGQPYTVKYQLLPPMLLNELQKQHTVVAAQQDVIKAQQGQIQTQGQQIADLQERLSRLESLIAKK